MTDRSALLAALTADDVRAEAAALAEQAARLNRMADAMDDRANDPPQPPPVPRIVTPPKRAAPPSSKRPAILAVMRAAPDRSWSPKQVFDGLVERGDIDPDTNLENVRVTIHRMSRANELVKINSGEYKLPAPNGAATSMFEGGGS